VKFSVTGENFVNFFISIYNVHCSRFKEACKMKPVNVMLAHCSVQFSL